MTGSVCRDSFSTLASLALQLQSEASEGTANQSRQPCLHGGLVSFSQESKGLGDCGQAQLYPKRV